MCHFLVLSVGDIDVYLRLPFSKAHALSYKHSKVGNDQMHIRGEMTSGKLTLSGFVRSWPESLW